MMLVVLVVIFSNLGEIYAVPNNTTQINDTNLLELDVTVNKAQTNINNTTVQNTTRTADKNTNVERISGQDPVSISIELSKKFGTASTAVLARADMFPDALCAGPLSAQLGAPLFLIDSQELRNDVLSALKTLGVGKIIIIGGNSAISSSIEENLKQEYQVERIGGKDRYETSSLIAQKIDSEQYGILTTGLNWPDAIASTPLAHTLRAPVLITRTDEIPDGIMDIIKTKDLQIYILGGFKAVPSSLGGEIKRMGRFVERIGGDDRYETSLLIGEKMLSILSSQGGEDGGLTVARGDQFCDALIASPYASINNMPILLTNPTSMQVDSLSFIKKENFNKIYIIGGPSSVSKDIEETIKDNISQQTFINQQNNVNQQTPVNESKYKGVWVMADDADNINLNELKNAGITDIFVKCNRISTPTYPNVLKNVISKAKGAGIRIHSWITCFRNADGTWIPAENTDHQDVLIEAISDMARNYDINGIHLDYVRYGGTASQHPNATETITSFVKRVYTTVKSIKSNVMVSAAVMPEGSSNADIYGQDYEKLAPYLDLMIPMLYEGNYNEDNAWIGTITKYIVEKSGNTPVIAGIQTYVSDNDLTLLTANDINKDINSALENGAQGYVLFRYGMIDENFF